MAKFTNLHYSTSYDIVSATSGEFLTQGIQGGEAMRTEWPEGSEAYESGEMNYDPETDEVTESVAVDVAE